MEKLGLCWQTQTPTRDLQKTSLARQPFHFPKPEVERLACETSKRPGIGSEEKDECPALVNDEIWGHPCMPLSVIEEFCWESPPPVRTS